MPNNRNARGRNPRNLAQVRGRFTDARGKKAKGKTAFNALHSYDNQKNNLTDKKARKAPAEWDRFNSSSAPNNESWNGNNPIKAGEKMFGKTATMEGHYKANGENGQLSRRQVYYNVRVGLGLSGG